MAQRRVSGSFPDGRSELNVLNSLIVAIKNCVTISQRVFVPSIWAQFGHNAGRQKGPASLQALEELVAGAGFEPATFGL
jgi:hypothetical protein